MRRMKLADLMEKDRLYEYRKKELDIIARRDAGRPVRRRPRDPEEARLLTILF